MVKKETPLRAKEILEDRDFKTLAGQKNNISLMLTVLQLLLYFGFIGLIALNKPFMSTKVSGAITIGIPLAVGTILLSWVLTGVYVRWANTKYDHLVRQVKEKFGA